MAWTVDYSATALEAGARTRQAACAPHHWNHLDERVIGSADPRSAGKALGGPLGGLWRYRVGDYRVICSIEDGVMRVLVLQIGNRREVYR